MDQTITKFLCICLLLCSISYITQAQSTDALVDPHSGASHYKCDHANYKAAVEAKMGETQHERSLNKMAGCRKVRVFYVIPSDAQRRDREQICEASAREIQQQWASQGRTAYFEPIITINSNQPQSWFNGTGTDWSFLTRSIEVVTQNYGWDANQHRTLIFTEFLNAPGAYGADSDGVAGMPAWAIDGIEYQLEADFRPEIGAVGHELGHAFSMGHEDGNDGSVNCDNQCVPKGVMCNGYSPSPCGPQTSYPYVALNNYNLGKMNRYPDYFTEIGSSCNGPKFVSQYGNSRPTPGIANKYKISAKHSNKALALAADGNVVQQTYTGADNQHWYFTAPQYNMTRPDSYSYYQIKNASNNNNLEVPYGAMNDGDNVGAYSALDVNHQKWKVIDRSGGHFAFQNLKSGRMLDVAGGSQSENGNIHQWNWGDSQNQQWSLELVDGTLSANCTDGILNGDETAIDCGGSCPSCNGGGNGTCSYTFTNLSPVALTVWTFVNGVSNFNYATIPVGATSIITMPAGLTNSSGAVGLYLNNPNGSFESTGWDSSSSGSLCGSSIIYDSCSDGLQNLDETGIDIGGSCTTSSCTDGVQNGDETGLDCGGSCPACPTCFDGIQNGTETGIDCGGTCQLVCTPTCNDCIQNGNETGIDCGGDCAPCNPGASMCTVTLTNAGCAAIDVHYYDTPMANPQAFGALPGNSSVDYTSAAKGIWVFSVNGEVLEMWNTDCSNPIYIFEDDGTAPDSDNDGICDANDVCPNFDDALIGELCDDADACTTEETYDASCNCTGGMLVDENNNGICDSEELACPDVHIITDNPAIDYDIHVVDYIKNNGLIEVSTNVSFKAGNYIELVDDFEVELGAEFEARIEVCE